MLPQDERTPGTYFFTSCIGNPDRLGETYKVTLHADGVLQIHWSEEESQYLHRNALESHWPRLGRTVEQSRANTANVCGIKLPQEG